MADVLTAPLPTAPSAMASAPYRPRRRTATVVLIQYLALIRVLLGEYRSTWFFHVTFGFLMPMGMIFFLRYAGGGITLDRGIYLLGGNLATAIVFGPTMMLVGKLGWGRQNREFDYWATLPLGKLTLILAILSVFLLFALPGMIGIYVVGSLVLGLPFTPAGLWLLPLIPLEAMPAPLRLLAPLTPITYVADAFRAVLAGHFGASFTYDVLILLGFTAVFLVLVHRKLDWRAA